MNLCMCLQKTVIASFVMLELHIHTDHMVFFFKHDETNLLISCGRLWRFVTLPDLDLLVAGVLLLMKYVLITILEHISK